MARYNRRPAGATATSPIATTTLPSGQTHEGGPGYLRDPKGELFLLAAGSMVAENSFYETADARVERFRSLVQALAVTDPDWTIDFLTWLRADGNIRTAAVMGAAEFVRARQAAGLVDDAHTRRVRGYGRRVVDAVCQRADEPCELIAYWMSRYGRTLPKPVKRGLGDAIIRLGTEFAYVKWDSEARGVRWADLLALCHPGDRDGAAQRLRGDWQRDLFGHAVAERYRPTAPPTSCELLTRRRVLLSMPVDERRQVLEHPEVLRIAGMTWEALAGWLQGPMDAAAWAAILPSMGIMARLRNLRNFDEAGLTDEQVAPVLAQLVNPVEIARSRQFPFRFYSAYRSAPSLRWGHALERALQHSLANLPRLGGRTLILVDTSSSMTSRVSAKSSVSYAEIAALFGVALAARGEQVDLCGFADGVFQHRVEAGASVLREVQRFTGRIGEVGHGTRIADSVAAAYAGHDRVVVISDMQTMPGATPHPHLHVRGYDVHGRPRLLTELVPAHVPLYGFSLGGYQHAAAPSGVGNRHEFGALGDAAFRMLPMLESGRAGVWPWQTNTTTAA